MPPRPFRILSVQTHTMNASPAPVFAQLDSYSLAYHSLNRWKDIFDKEYLPLDILDKIEDIISALEYIEGWEPSDADMIANNPVGTAWHDGCR
jgi:hypothetical protein